MRVAVRCGRVPVGLLTMLVCRLGMSLGLIVLALCVVVCGLMMMVSRSVMGRGRVQMVLMRGMLRRLSHA